MTHALVLVARNTKSAVVEFDFPQMNKDNEQATQKETTLVVLQELQQA